MGPPGRSGRGSCRSGSVAALLAAAGPDEREGLTVLVVEEVGLDRSSEARIVELDRQVVEALQLPRAQRSPLGGP